MRALQFKAFGDPAAQLALVDLPDPQPRSGWAVVRVDAASVNPSDVKNVAGQMEGTVLPRVPGRDFSGVVEAGPSDWVGTEVWGTGGDAGFTLDGSHAGLIAVPESALARRPAALDQAQAASVGVAFVVGWMGLADYGGLQKGEGGQRKSWLGPDRWCPSNRYRSALESGRTGDSLMETFGKHPAFRQKANGELG